METIDMRMRMPTGKTISTVFQNQKFICRSCGTFYSDDPKKCVSCNKKKIKRIGEIQIKSEYNNENIHVKFFLEEIKY